MPFCSALIMGCGGPEVTVLEKNDTGLPSDPKSITVFSTVKDTDLKLSNTGSYAFTDAEQALESEVSVFVNPKKTFQTLLGIGGAITDASAEVYAKLPQQKQDELMAAYFSEAGINYSLLRTPIHSCDFSPYSYTYIEEGDSLLETFNIDHDREFRIPMLKKAMRMGVANKALYVSPWSPPAFMKTNGNMLQGGKLKPEFYEAWASYYVKFIKAYEKEGLPIWGLTIQNEPMAVQRWESCIYTAEEERDFLKNNLGPKLHQNGLADKKVVVWDHNRDLISHRANTIFEDEAAAQYAWGIGMHWYETWTGGEPMQRNLDNIQESYPDKNILFTEGCNEGFNAEKYMYWPNAERYGKAMINDFNQGTVGWTDWNILLDEKGGPNHVGNLCFAPIHADLKTNELIYTPSYYYIGHFSKFIKPGAKRVSTTTSRSNIIATTFQNEDGSMVSVLMNETNQAIDYKYVVDSKEVRLNIPARAMQSILIR